MATRKTSLDLMRILAMFGVLLIHSTMYIPYGPIRKYLDWGGNGTQIFFVLSGFLAAVSLTRGISIKEYYRRRIVRIVPAYYIMIICGALMHYFVVKDVCEDIFFIGWIRYFLGLNALLPSNNYNLWNNMYGLWTMSAFIWFYVAAPFFVKYIRTSGRSVIVFVLSIGLSVVWRGIAFALFGGMQGLDSIDVLIGASPFGVLPQFMIGTMVCFFIQDDNKMKGIATLCAIAIIGLIMQRDKIVWSCLTGLWIIATENICCSLPGRIERIVQFVARESFHVYMSHMIAFELAHRILAVRHGTGWTYYSCWILLSLFIVVLMCFCLRVSEKVIEKVFIKNRYKAA